MARQKWVMRVPLLLALAAASSGGCATAGRDVSGIRNFAKVNDDLYRGGQPSHAGITSLKKLGIKTVINLRDDLDHREKRWAEEAGMKYVTIASTARRVRPAQVAEFLDEMASAPRPIFVHCHRGRDRTGLNVAVYRVVKCGWSRDAALRELHAHGYQWAAYPGIARYVGSFDPVRYGALTAAAAQ